MSEDIEPKVISDMILVVGGPHHGQMVEDVGKLWQPLVQMSDPTNPLAPTVALPINYIKRWVVSTDPVEDNKHIRRAVYTHESITHPQQMMDGIASILFSTWLHDGGELFDQEEQQEIRGVGANPHPVVPDRNGERANQMGNEPPKTASGLYLP